jgi:hypothetical protein
MSEAQDIERLFAIWEQNVKTVRALNNASNRKLAKVRYPSSWRT